MKLIRVFPRRTKASPVDELAFFGPPPFYAEADRIHISVTFSFDKPHAEWLAEQWRHVAPVEISGPAYGIDSGEFEPGKYLKPGYVITSRGCPNKCWFCDAWKREQFKELEVKEGNNLLDDNILACSDAHIKAVFSMLEKQPRVEFTGGLEAARLREWHVDSLLKIKPDQMFFAYDTPDDFEPLVHAGKMLKDAGFALHSRRCYVLIGYPKDSTKAAEKRLIDCWKAGFIPMAMVYLNKNGTFSHIWKRLQDEWTRPAIIKTRMKNLKF